MRTPPPAVPGDRRGELEPAEAGVARAVEADGVRRAAAGDEHRPLDRAPRRARRRAGARARRRRRRARAGSSRARSPRPRCPRRPPTRAASRARRASRPREEARRPAGAERRVARERDALLDRGGHVHPGRSPALPRRLGRWRRPRSSSRLPRAWTTRSARSALRTPRAAARHWRPRDAALSVRRHGRPRRTAASTRIAASRRRGSRRSTFALARPATLPRATPRDPLPASPSPAEPFRALTQALVGGVPGASAVRAAKYDERDPARDGRDRRRRRCSTAIEQAVEASSLPIAARAVEATGWSSSTPAGERWQTARAAVRSR